jgi:hypothetical protein
MTVAIERDPIYRGRKAPRFNGPRPPMQQISKIRLESDEDVKNVESVRLLRKVVITKGLCLHVTPKGGRSWLNAKLSSLALKSQLDMQVLV